MPKAQTSVSETAPAQAAESTLLDQIVKEGKLGTEGALKVRGRDMVREFIDQFVQGSMRVERDADLMIKARTAQIDRLISLQLNEILHNESFQKLEGSWRGLKHLMDHSETGVGLKIKVLNVTKRELVRDFEHVAEFDQSALFKKVYEEEFGTFGGAPYGALIGDFEFGKHPEDMDLLKNIAEVAAQAHAPFISAAAPRLV